MGFPFPLTPLFSRKTVCNTLVINKIWTFEQEQGIGLGLGVSTSVVMTVVRMEDGKLWVHDPIAPTVELLDLLRLHCGDSSGTAIDVKYIVLATTQYEHKIFVAPFSRKFPNAEVWIAPGQFSFPVNLPNQFFGIFPTGYLDAVGSNMPWSSEIEQKLLRLPPLFWNQYTYCECAFLVKSTGTLIVTDAAVFVSENPPKIIEDDLLTDLGDENGFTIGLLRFGNYRGGRNLPGAGVTRKEGPEICKIIGWNRMALFSLFIAPDAKNILQPKNSFDGLRNKFVVSPIVFAVVFQFHRKLVWNWASSIQHDWGDSTNQIVSGHFPSYSGQKKGEAVGKFVEAFEWANSDDKKPKEYVDSNDLKSLELVVNVLRFLKAVPEE